LGKEAKCPALGSCGGAAHILVDCFRMIAKETFHCSALGKPSVFVALGETERSESTEVALKQREEVYPC
jgi:hypothetical protein